MVIRTIKTSKAEADHIMNKDIHYVFRSVKENVKTGDVIQFLVYKDGRPVLHAINGKDFVVTAIQDHRLAPIEDGWQIIGFRVA